MATKVSLVWILVHVVYLMADFAPYMAAFIVAFLHNMSWLRYFVDVLYSPMAQNKLQLSGDYRDAHYARD